MIMVIFQIKYKMDQIEHSNLNIFYKCKFEIIEIFK